MCVMCRWRQTPKAKHCIVILTWRVTRKQEIQRNSNWRSEPSPKSLFRKVLVTGNFTRVQHAYRTKAQRWMELSVKATPQHEWHSRSLGAEINSFPLGYFCYAVLLQHQETKAQDWGGVRGGLYWRPTLPRSRWYCVLTTHNLLPLSLCSRNSCHPIPCPTADHFQKSPPLQGEVLNSANLWWRRRAEGIPKKWKADLFKPLVAKLGIGRDHSSSGHQDTSFLQDYLHK